jgi:hypothetical protein
MPFYYQAQSISQQNLFFLSASTMINPKFKIQTPNEEDNSQRTSEITADIK